MVECIPHRIVENFLSEYKIGNYPSCRIFGYHGRGAGRQLAELGPAWKSNVGQVFAMVRNGYLEYPALVGICSGCVRGVSFDNPNRAKTIDESVSSAYGIVTPLDKLLIHETKK